MRVDQHMYNTSPMIVQHKTLMMLRIIRFLLNEADKKGEYTHAEKHHFLWVAATLTDQLIDINEIAPNIGDGVNDIPF